MVEPNCFQTECGLIGAFLLGGDAWNSYGYDLDPSLMNSEQLKEILKYMQKENTCELSLISDRFPKYVVLLSQCMENPLIRIEAGIKLIEEYYRKRQIFNFAIEAQKEACAGATDSDNIVSGFIEKCSKLSFNERAVTSLDDILPEAAMSFETRKGSGEYGLKTGFVDVDKVLGDMVRGDMVIVAGRPSMGKSSWITNIIRHQTGTVLIFSLEMDKVLTASRLITAEGEVSYGGGRSGLVDRACKRLAGRSIFIDDTPAISMGQIISRCKKIKAQHGLDLVVVDHVGLMSVPKGRSENEEVGAIFTGLKNLARELECVVMPLSQLNRGVEMRQDKRPMLSDLRSSGVGEQDADKVVMLYRPEYYNHNDSPGVAEILIRKNRNGAVGTVNLTFRKECMRFDNYSESDSW